jgi:hypothetical protein
MCGSNWLYLQSHYISYHRRLACAVHHVRVAKKGRIHLYHVTVVQELQPPDMQKRVVYFRWFKTFLAQNSEIWDTRQFSDEAWFHQAEYIDFRICACGPLQILPLMRSPSVHRKWGCGVLWHQEA